MVKEVVEKVKKSVSEKVKGAVTETIEEKSEELIYVALSIAVAGMIFSYAGKLVPTRTNLHIYIHMK